MCVATIFVAAVAGDATSARELGHWLGLSHVPQRNHVMSDDHDEGHTFLAPNQKAIVVGVGLARARSLARDRFFRR